MQKVLSSEEMREVDRLTTEKYGIPSIILMENAAHATARIITEKLGGSVEGKSFLILCGKGNNGGDGAALARALATQGASVDVIFFVDIDESKGDAKTNFEIIKTLTDAEDNLPRQTEGVWIGTESAGTISLNYCLSLKEWLEDEDICEIRSRADVVVDALFGTGLTRKLEGIYSIVAQSIAWEHEDRLSKDKPYIVSLDLPSGLDADSSKTLGVNTKADLTVSFTAPKLANVLAPASSFNGELHVVDIGSPEQLVNDVFSQTFVTQLADLESWFYQTSFSSDSYKNRRGSALLIVGSRRYSGAAVLAGNAAMVSGVGLVTVATSESAHESVSKRVLPEVITQNLEETINGAIGENAFEKIELLSDKADVVAIGCGLNSTVETTRKLVRKVVEERTTPIVIDADGLNSLSPFDLKGSAELPLILTPHEGEFLRLLGVTDKDAIKDRVQAVRDFSRKHNVILVLKGERTLIAEPSMKVVINPTGNSGLGKAGNGDTLTGIITGFIAQAIQAKVDIFETVVVAVYIAGLAGDIAEKKFGKRTMLASDVRECLADAFTELENEKQ